MASDASDSFSEDDISESVMGEPMEWNNDVYGSDFSFSDQEERLEWDIEFSDDTYASVCELCKNDNRFPEHVLTEQLMLKLESNPDVLRQTEDNGKTLLHHAIDYWRSFDFCKVIISNNPDLVKIPGGEDTLLPIHAACNLGVSHTELIKFLIAQYPESVNIPDANGCYPVHSYVVSNGGRLDVLQLLLKCDEKALSTPNIYGDIPLHNAVKKIDSVDDVKELFNAYPQALYSKDENGDTPLDIARFFHENMFRRRNDSATPDFLQDQIDLTNQASQVITPDENGQLPIHRALQRKSAPFGTIKLMVASNPVSVSIADYEGMIPLHIASRSVDLRIVKLLVESNVASLNISDSKGNFPLHHACLGGNCDVVNFILSQSTHGVSKRNTDGKLPIELLFYEVGYDYFDENDDQWRRDMGRSQEYRDTQEYVEAVYHLLCLYPDGLKELAE